MIFRNPQNLPPDARPFEYQFPSNSAYSAGVLSKEWRDDLSAFEDEKKAYKLENSNVRHWSEQESLSARSERARQLITSTNNNEIMTLLEDHDIIKLISEKRSLVRLRGNAEAHRVVEQALVLEEMVQQCAAQLESFEVAGLLAMIKKIHPTHSDSSNTQ